MVKIIFKVLNMIFYNKGNGFFYVDSLKFFFEWYQVWYRGDVYRVYVQKRKVFLSYICDKLCYR